MRTAKFYKLARPNGFDFKTGNTLNYRENIGKTVFCPNQKDAAKLCKCTYTRINGKPCTREYPTEQQLHSHVMANHWKEAKRQK